MENEIKQNHVLLTQKLIYYEEEILFIVAIIIAVAASTCMISCSDDDDNNPLVGTWSGDHSESYFVDWTFKGDGTGECHIQDGDMGVWHKIIYSIKDYDSSTRSGHVDITYTSGDRNGETRSCYFEISESGRALTLDGGYYLK